MVVYSILPLVLALSVAWLSLLLGLLVVLGRRRREPPGSETVQIVVLAIAFAAVSSFLGYGAVQVYTSQNTWNFHYAVAILGSGTGPESVIVPIPQDESLVADLHLTAGTANWSLVDTAKGRGLYVRFTGDASLEASVSAFPAPSPLPDTSPTMQDTANASGGTRIWVFYATGLGGHVDLTFPSWYVQIVLVPGWTSVAMWPDLPPIA